MSGARASLSSQALQGTVWAYLSFITGKVLVFVSTVILARLLAPSEFGLMGYALLTIQYLDALNTFGVDSAVISRTDRVEEAANAAFAIAVGASLAMYGLAWVGAPSVATFFDSAEVTNILRVVAVVLVIDAVGSIPSAMIQRRLRFKAKFVPDVARSILKGTISVVLAWQGFGVWSLIWGQVAGESIATITLWIIAGWRPTLKFERDVTLEVLAFGKHIVSAGLIGSFLINVDYLLVGRILGAAALGYYTLAYRVPELIIRNTNLVIGRVAFPVLAQLQTDLRRLRNTFILMMRYLALFAFPVGVGLALVAPRFIEVFYGSRWESATVSMQCISLAIAISAIGHIPGVIYKAINRPEILNWTSAIKLVIAVGLLWYGTRWGISGVAAMQIVLAVFNVTLDLIVVVRVLRFNPLDILHALTPSLAAVGVMTIAYVAVATLLAPSGFSGMLALIAVGAVAYGAAIVMLSRSTLIQARAALRNAFGRAGA